jgi:hypothetical protein
MKVSLISFVGFNLATKKPHARRWRWRYGGVGAGSTWPQTKEDIEKHHTRLMLNSVVLWVELPIQGWVFHERAPTQYLNGTYPNVESFHVNIGLPNPLLSCDSFRVCFYEIYLLTLLWLVYCPHIVWDFMPLGHFYDPLLISHWWTTT